jgi:imidazolonepropionase-like amidohydrolase
MKPEREFRDYLQDILETMDKESVRQAYEAGVKIAMGTDCGTPFNVAGKNTLELELLMQNGVSTAAALMATTRVAAEAIGIQDHAGTLEPGK